ncbi:MAG: FAD-binding domain-containing protein [Opitutales bacterium]
MNARDAETAVVWFKRDLRVYDHRALAEAASRYKSIIPVYCREPSIRSLPDFGVRHDVFIESSLSDLQHELRSRGSDLLILDMEVIDAFRWLFKKTPFAAVFAHEETGNLATFERDKTIIKWCRSNGVRLHEYYQNGVQRGLKQRYGWARVWHQRMHEQMIPAPATLPSIPGPLKEITAALRRGTQENVYERGGRTAGLQVLNTFLLSRGRAYHREMSSPLTAENSCSRLSSYISYGCLSMREIVQAAEARKLQIRTEGGDGYTQRALTSFLSRCHWHCHFMQKLELEPAIETKCFNRACETLRERGTRTDLLEQFQAGQTGYPFLDACIRFLDAKGWINFRMRAMITSFAAYNLWIDWRDFKDWLACQFQDYEPGIHYSQLQMQSGVTGINTLRIYNLVKQGLDQDPQGQFIRRWVPELAKLPDVGIHEPWKLPQASLQQAGVKLGNTYPLPIVDLKESSRLAKSKFSEVRRNPLFWEESERVQRMHGSRKRQPDRRRAKPKLSDNEQMELSLEG